MHIFPSVSRSAWSAGQLNPAISRRYQSTNFGTPASMGVLGAYPSFSVGAGNIGEGGWDVARLRGHKFHVGLTAKRLFDQIDQAKQGYGPTVPKVENLKPFGTVERGQDPGNDIIDKGVVPLGLPLVIDLDRFPRCICLVNL